jgi:hypothetical protein
MGERGGAYNILVWKPEGKMSLVRRRLRWEDTIKVGIQELGWGYGLD